MEGCVLPEEHQIGLCSLLTLSIPLGCLLLGLLLEGFFDLLGVQLFLVKGCRGYARHELLERAGLVHIGNVRHNTPDARHEGVHLLLFGLISEFLHCYQRVIIVPVCDKGGILMGDVLPLYLGIIALRGDIVVVSKHGHLRAAVEVLELAGQLGVIEVLLQLLEAPLKISILGIHLISPVHIPSLTVATQLGQHVRRNVGPCQSFGLDRGGRHLLSHEVPIDEIDLLFDLGRDCLRLRVDVRGYD